MTARPRGSRSAAAAVLTLRLLGPLELRRDGVRVPLPPSKKTRALLAYLATTGRPHTRGHLCDLLWDGPDDPRGGLRWSLAKLRPLLVVDDESCLLTDGEEVSLDLGRVTTDLAVVRAAAAAGLSRLDDDALDGAARAFAGNFAEGLEVATAARFRAWCAGEREHLHGVRRAVWSARSARAGPDSARLLELAHDWLRIDPLDEEAHATVVRALGALGRGRDAMRHYDTCRALLAQELGARPAAVIEEARRAIGAGPLVAAPSPTPSPVASARSPVSPPSPATSAALDPARPGRAVAPRPPPTPFVGRDAVLARVIQAIETPEDRPRIVLLSGEPGMGKTRLLDEILHLRRHRGAQVLLGRAYATERSLPFGVWSAALRGIAAPGWLPVAQRPWLAPILPECGEAHAFGNSAAIAHAQLGAAVTAVLRAVAATASGVVVGLDDAQWMDDASLALFSVVLHDLDADVTFVLTARDAELLDHETLRDVLGAARRDGILTTCRVDPLDLAACAHLVRATGVPQDAEVARLAQQSEGNPFVAIELARAQQDGGGAARLDSLLAERLDQLSPAAQRLAPWLAALGRQVDVPLLEALLATQEPEAFAGLEELERRGVIRATGENFEFAHDLLREAAYERLSAPRRRLVHGRIARTLAARSDPLGVHAGEAFHHATLAGLDDVIARTAAPAADRLLRAFAAREATALADRGRAALAALPAAEQLPTEVALLAVLVHAGVHRHRHALLDDLAALSTRADREGLADVAVRANYLVSVVREELGDPEGAALSAHQQSALARDADLATQVFSHANSGRCLAMLERDIDHARRELDEAERLARQAGVWSVEIPLGRGFVAYFEGDMAGARLQWTQGLAEARAADDHWRASLCLSRLAMLEIEAGDVAAARAWVERLAPVAAAIGEGSEAIFAAVLAELCTNVDENSRRRDPARAAAAAAAALAGLRAVDSKAQLAWVLLRLAEHACLRGDAPTALDHAREAQHLAHAVGRASLAAEAQAMAAHLAAVLEQPFTMTDLPSDAAAASLSARAQLALRIARTAITTLLHTPAPTPPSDAVSRRRRTSATSDRTHDGAGATVPAPRRRRQ